MEGDITKLHVRYSARATLLLSVLLKTGTNSCAAQHLCQSENLVRSSSESCSARCRYKPEYPTTAAITVAELGRRVGILEYLLLRFLSELKQITQEDFNRV